MPDRRDLWNRSPGQRAPMSVPSIEYYVSLASHGIFQEKSTGQFDHTPLSHCLRSDAEGSFRSAAQMMHRVYPAWDGLHHAIMTGDSGFNKVFGQPLFDYIGTHPDLAPIFDAGMTAIHGHETAAMLEAYDFSATMSSDERAKV